MKKYIPILITLFIAPFIVGFSQSIYEKVIDQKDKNEKLKIRIKTTKESYYNSFFDVFGYPLPPFDSLEEKKQKIESQQNYYSALIHIKEQLSILNNDKDYFSHLSNPMQKHLSEFILDINEKLLGDYSKISNEEISINMINISKQEECFSAELRYQNGEIQEEEMKAEIENILYPGFRNTSGN